MSFSLFFSACAQNQKWAKAEIDNKLKTVFPNASRIIILDSNAARNDTADKLNMLLPVYKALVKEKNDSNYNFIFYFYHSSPYNSAFSGVMKQVMVNYLRAGLGTAISEYMLALPQFDKTGIRLVAYAASLTISDNGYLVDIQKKITTVFGLQETRIRNVELKDLKDQ